MEYIFENSSDYIGKPQFEEACPFLHDSDKFYCVKAARKIEYGGCNPNGIECRVFRAILDGYLGKNKYEYHIF